MKMIHKITILFITALFVLSACAPAGVQSQTGPYTINASGTGKVYMTPDIAYVSFGVHTEANSVAEAVQKNNDQARALNKTLTDLGVDQKDIQTSSFSVAPLEQLDSQEQPGKNYYAVDNTVDVTVRDLNNIGKLLDGAINSGANKVNGLTFDIKDKSKSTSEARRLAVEDAKAQALELANDAGVKLGKLTALNSFTNLLGAAQNNVKTAQFADGGGSIPTSAGQLVIQVEANISYEIVQ